MNLKSASSQRELMFKYLREHKEGTSTEICDYIIVVNDQLFKQGLTPAQKRKSVSGSLNKAYNEGKVRRKIREGNSSFIYFL